jgi:hypothetical protein
MEAGEVTLAITQADYHAIGDVTGALAKRAQQIYYAETEQEKNEFVVTHFRCLFTHLVPAGAEYFHKT